MKHEEYKSSTRAMILPEGVRAWGYRYQAVIVTPAKTHIIGEFESITEAELAYQDAAQAQWTG